MLLNEFSPAVAEGFLQGRQSMSAEEQLRTYFRTLYAAWGRQHWWPAESPFEVIVGAYLTQNTSWTNVERALKNLREARLLSASGIRRTPLRKLEKLIRPSGYFRQKAQRLKTFVDFLDQNYGGSLARMFSQPTSKLRDELLSLNGVGPETADSILLYAGDHPSFVVDAYTRRILERHHLIDASATYDEIRELFDRALRPLTQEILERPSSAASGPGNSCHSPTKMSAARREADVQIFNEMHGLIVGVAKNYCKKSQTDCERCPLKKFLPASK